ncbi:DUF2750 domain-containing protein [Phyllobacterium myrsinacearum]|uniref:Uncharacterized protein n=1 Tax=Phyllobacterium myrsinacearum TaxID=28101 RepID=A0A839EG53_9HYPH|nr:DUF2750 domain-containing protein [Phyllobacterium myrsinacearum]MBA8879153.1 hypothetical protein [Phyllobacterium myrsinacearum]
MGTLAAHKDQPLAPKSELGWEDLTPYPRVFKLSHAQRYKHFIKKSVETYTVYTINVGANSIVVNNVAGTSMCCPLWPAAIFAELWMGPSAQGAAALFNPFLPALKQRGLKAGICFDRATCGPVEPANKVIADIKSEIQAGFSYQIQCVWNTDAAIAQ